MNHLNANMIVNNSDQKLKPQYNWLSLTIITIWTGLNFQCYFDKQQYVKHNTKKD